MKNQSLRRGATTVYVVIVGALFVACGLAAFQTVETDTPPKPVAAPEVNDLSKPLAGTVCLKTEIANYGSFSIYEAEICSSGTMTYVYEAPGLGAGNCSSPQLPQCFGSAGGGTLKNVMLAGPGLSDEALIKVKTMALWKDAKVVLLTREN